MNITIVSKFRDGYTVGLESAYERAFLALGHKVSRVRSDLPPGTIPKLGRFEARLRLPLHQRHLKAQIIEQAPQLVVIVKGTGLAASTVRELRVEGLTVVNIFPDNPFEAAAQAYPSPELLKQMQHLHATFVPDRFSAGQLRAQGVAAEFLAFARDPGAHAYRPEDPIDEDAPPLVFVGNPDGERIRYLRAVADLGLRLYGQWEWANLSPSDPLRACVAGGPQLGPDMVRAMRSAKLSLNVLRQSQKTAHNMRTFEIPATGVCAIGEHTVCVAELMHDGVETVLFRSPEELRARVIKLLEAPGRIAEIAQAGFERVRHDTYERRATEVLEYLGFA